MRRIPPVWLMGLSNATVGLNAGIVFFVMPQLLAAGHISEAIIATVTAVAMASNFWTVIFGPMLDVRFSRRWYATVFAGVAGALVIVSIMNPHRLVVLQPALALAVAAAILSSTALGGWLSNVTFTFLVAATFVPVAYMIVVDGKGYFADGIAGSLAIDASVSITVCILLGVFLARLPGNAFSAGVPQVELNNALPQDML